MDVEKVVDKLSEFGLIKTNRISGNWYSIYCPFHNDGNERRPSCGVLLHDEWRGGVKYPEGLFHCFTCGSAYTLVEAVSKILKLKGNPSNGIDWLKDNIPDFDLDDDDDSDLVSLNLIESLQTKYAVKTLLDKQPVAYVSEEELSKYRYTVPYMYQRKLTDEVIQKYDIGVDLNWVPPGRSKPVPCITFPVRDKSMQTLFLCRRSIEGKLFNYPEGVTKPVYGIEMLPNNCKSVVICESCFNALTAVVYGYNAVALLGTSNAFQIEQLRRLGTSEFVLCMDGDDAGRRASRKLKRALSDVAIVWTINMPDGKDLNDCTKEEFDSLYMSRE